MFDFTVTFRHGCSLNYFHDGTNARWIFTYLLLLFVNQADIDTVVAVYGDGHKIGENSVHNPQLT